MRHRDDNQMQIWYEEYTKSKIRTLDEIYSKYSQDKLQGYYNALNLQVKLDGLNGKIVTHNVMMFTYGFICEYMDSTVFVLVTKDNIYYKEI